MERTKNCMIVPPKPSKQLQFLQLIPLLPSCQLWSPHRLQGQAQMTPLALFSPTGILQGLPGSTDRRMQHEHAVRNVPGEEDSPGWQAPIAPPASQQEQHQLYSRQISTIPNAKSSKKTHPLYTSTPSYTKKATQQRKPKAKPNDGFAIRLPATQTSSAMKPFSTSDALRQLTGASVNRPSVANDSTVQEPRPGSIAELLGDIQVANPGDTIEEIEAQEVQPALLSPSRQDNTRSLLDSIIDGQAHTTERPPVQGQQLHAQTPVMARLPQHCAAHASASTPSMTLQRQFIAGLQDTRTASDSQLQYSSSRTRGNAAAGSLTARLNKVLQLEKAQHAQFEASGSLDRHTMNVIITEQCLEGRVIKCRCHKGQNSADQLFVYFNSKFCHNVSLQTGCCVTLHAPWTELHIKGCSIAAILCQFVSACN